jgi:TolB protein
MPRRALPLTVLLCAAVAGAQEPTLRDVITGAGMRQVPIAVPAFAAPAGGAARQVAETVTEVLREDLAASGYFLLVEPDRYGLVPPGRPGEIPFHEWQGIGAEQLLLGTVEADGGRFQVEARLWDASEAKMILGRRYRGEADLARRLAHRIADEIVLYLTGTRGVAQSKIAFVARAGEAKEIFLMDYDGHRMRRLTQNGSLNLSPTWSPDGDRLALTSYKDGNPAVFILDRDGNSRRISLPGSPLNIAPDWSPDGRRIAYSAAQRGNTDVLVFDLETGRASRLTSNRAIDCCPSWSPNGREMAFTSDRGGTPQIYVMDAEGSNVRRLTYEGSYHDSAAWAPAGDRIAFVSRLDGNFHLQLLDLASRRVRRLTFGRSNNESPAWSPDGRHLAFASDRTGTYEIYRLRVDGGEPVRLTRTAGASSPAWAP